jgi:hypothetical protein
MTRDKSIVMAQNIPCKTVQEIPVLYLTFTKFQILFRVPESPLLYPVLSQLNIMRTLLRIASLNIYNIIIFIFLIGKKKFSNSHCFHQNHIYLP